MKQWKEKDFKFITDKEYFPECVECLQTYFHKPNCRVVTGGALSVPWEIINERLNKRLEVFEKKYGVGGSGIKCEHCQNAAVGQMHVFYHGTSATVEEWPACMEHAFYEDSAGRESQFKGF